MAKTAESNATVDQVAGQVAQAGMTITPEVLAMIAAAVAAAVKESKRDEKAEAEEARKEAERQMVRDEELQRIANLKARQDSCPHLDAYENFAFCGQKNCLGQLVFICSQCIKPFKPGDPDYNNFVRFVKWDRVGNARQN
jgi:hypothetical protein